MVAAPVFPLESADAPGGPDESDLVNEPGDISFVISQLLAASAAPGGALSGLIDPGRIAVGDNPTVARPRSRWPTPAVCATLACARP